MREDVLANYRLPAAVIACDRYGNGHIHETWRVECVDGGCYILQKMNVAVFPSPETVMRNLRLVTEHLQLRADDPREVLTLVPTADGESYCVVDGDYWRMFIFVCDSYCLERADTPAQFAVCAEGFARFVDRLRDFDASRLAETIPHFHDTPMRLSALETAAREDRVGRVKRARREIDFANAYVDFAGTFARLQEAGELMQCVTHNDTKMNNLLFDCETNEALCVLDLDTVMPGWIMNDFGDAIRYGASTAEEDARDTDSVHIDLTLYEAYTSGFCRICGESLTQLERMLLPTGAKMMTLETGVRFLTDYLMGDTYFHVRHPEQNLDRARAQFALLRDMEARWSEMQRITKRCLNGAR